MPPPLLWRRGWQAALASWRSIYLARMILAGVGVASPKGPRLPSPPRCKCCRRCRSSTPRADLGDEGAAAIATLVSRSSTLSALLLADNAIGEAGCQSLASAIASTAAPLSALCISDNPIEASGLAAIVKALISCNPSSSSCRSGTTSSPGEVKGRLRSLEVAMDRGSRLSSRASSKRAGRPLPDDSAGDLADLLRSPSGSALTALDVSGTFELGGGAGVDRRKRRAAVAVARDCGAPAPRVARLPARPSLLAGIGRGSRTELAAASRACEAVC